jgi:phosphate transport system substrate-binding protein
MTKFLRTVAAPLFVMLAVACGGGGDADAAGGELNGRVEIDGSSTVLPLAEAVMESFQDAHPRARVTVATSGTGGGFKRFCAGETQISDASRPIKAEEAALCAENSVDFMEVRVAWDGLSVVVNPSNSFVQCLTVAELRRIWEPGSTVERWSEIRSEFPDMEIALYGAGTDSGTFDYFTEVIMGEGGASRPDYQGSENDNILVQGIAGDEGALGYFGYAYAVANPGRVKLVAVDGGGGCVLPETTTIEDGSYAPLSRPLFMYVRTSALAEPTTRAFVEHLLTNAGTLVPPTGYIPLSPSEYAEILTRVQGAGMTP